MSGSASVPGRPLAAVAVVLLVVTAGCYGGTTEQYVLTATDVTGEVGEHATADLDRYERRVAERLAARTAGGNATGENATVGTNTTGGNATVETVGWHPLDDGDYVGVNGSYYLIDGEQVGERRVRVPHLAIVPANGSADLRREDLDQPDRELVGLAHRLAEMRAEEDGPVRSSRYAAPYHYGANESALLDANGSLLRAFDTTYRVVVFEAERSADVYEYRAERVASGEAAFARHVSRNATLDDEERAVLDEALAEEYVTDVEEVENGERPGFVGLTDAAGLEREGVATEATAYVHVDGRYYELELRFRRLA